MDSSRVPRKHSFKDHMRKQWTIILRKNLEKISKFWKDLLIVEIENGTKGLIWTWVINAACRMKGPQGRRAPS